MVARGRAGGPPARGAAANRAGRGGAAAGGRGAARQTARGAGRAKGSLPGKRRRLGRCCRDNGAFSAIASTRLTYELLTWYDGQFAGDFSSVSFIDDF